MKTLVQWGAGNIGRSFIGQLFSRNGWKVIFIDIDSELVSLLNEKHSYTVTFVDDIIRESVIIENVAAVDGRDEKGVIEALLQADILSFSVGKFVHPLIAPLFGKALLARYRESSTRPLDVIIAENIHDGKNYIKALLKEHLPKEYPLDTLVGFVETSIGKMVPIQTQENKLELISEPFNTLVLDKEGFIGEIPPFKEIEAVSPIEAYVDRKLYIHNLGHAVAAYSAFAKYPKALYLAETLEDEEIFNATKRAMEEGSELLLATYEEVFTKESLSLFIEDLLERFKNSTLGDTLFRVGRDLKRKLGGDDRLMGAMLAAYKRGTSYHEIAKAYAKALSFRALDESGSPFEADEALLKTIETLPIEKKIEVVAGTPIPTPIIEEIKSSYYEQ